MTSTQRLALALAVAGALAGCIWGFGGHQTSRPQRSGHELRTEAEQSTPIARANWDSDGPRPFVHDTPPWPAVAVLLRRSSSAGPLLIEKGMVELVTDTIEDVLPPSVCAKTPCQTFKRENSTFRALRDGHCTATFIDKHTILTAGHCVSSGDWTRSYVLLGYTSAPHTLPYRVPVSRLARFSCAHISIDFGHGFPDWALIKVTPLTQTKTDTTATLDPHEVLEIGQSVALDEGVMVMSHMHGFPLLGDDVHVLDATSKTVSFTNSGAGSGAPLIQAGRIVGVARGNDMHNESVCARPDRGCIPQPVTWVPIVRPPGEVTRPFIFGVHRPTDIPICSDSDTPDTDTDT